MRGPHMQLYKDVLEAHICSKSVGFGPRDFVLLFIITIHGGEHFNGGRRHLAGHGPALESFGHGAQKHAPSHGQKKAGLARARIARN